MKPFVYSDVTVQQLKDFVSVLPATTPFVMENGSLREPGCLIEQYRQHVTGEGFQKCYYGSMSEEVTTFLRKLIKLTGRNTTAEGIRDNIPHI